MDNGVVKGDDIDNVGKKKLEINSHLAGLKHILACELPITQLMNTADGRALHITAARGNFSPSDSIYFTQAKRQFILNFPTHRIKLS
jgi:hypothetical protein